MPFSAPVPTHVPAPDQERQLALYKYDACGFCRRVLAAIHSLGLDIEVRDTLVHGDHRRDLRALTGRTQVPCLLIDDQPLLESLDIIAWLEAYAKRPAAG